MPRHLPLDFGQIAVAGRQEQNVVPVIARRVAAVAIVVAVEVAQLAVPVGALHCDVAGVDDADVYPVGIVRHVVGAGGEHCDAHAVPVGESFPDALDDAVFPVVFADGAGALLYFPADVGLPIEAHYAGVQVVVNVQAVVLHIADRLHRH